ncbi:MAG: transporter, partial [Nocardioides sp.]|nr:transporter [Nocardioides sp.]
AVSVGPVLDDVRAGLGMSGAEAGVLTALPVVAFAGFGALAPRLAAAVGPHRLTALSLTAVTAGLLARSRVDGVVPFLGLSLLALGAWPRPTSCFRRWSSSTSPTASAP